MSSLEKNELSLKAVCDEYVESYYQLVRANRLTGHWDGERGAMRRAYDQTNDQLVDPATFLKKFANTEKQSRKNCELRAVHRTRLDELWKIIVEKKYV